jgi:transposase
MDAAYDVKEIKDFIRRYSLLILIRETIKSIYPLIRKNRNGIKIRTTVERAYSHLKDNLIPRKLYVKGASKVSFILMIAIVCLAYQKYLQYFNPIIS